jgi:hypothetical protein
VAQWPLLPAGAGFPIRRGSSTLAICCSESLQQSIENIKKNILNFVRVDPGLNLLSKAINGRVLTGNVFTTYLHTLSQCLLQCCGSASKSSKYRKPRDASFRLEPGTALQATEINYAGFGTGAG